MTKLLFLFDADPNRPWVRDRLPGIHRALASCSDIEVTLADIYGIFGTDIEQASHPKCRKELLFKADVNRANEAFFRYVDQGQFSTIIFATVDNFREWLTIDLLQKLKEKDVKTLGFLGDDEFNFFQNRFYACLFDGVVVYTEFAKNLYSKIIGSERIFLMPNATSAVCQNMPEPVVPECDVLMIGAPIANRAAILKRCVDSGLSVEIYGSKKWQKIRELRPYYRGFVRSSDFDSTVRRGRFYLCPFEDHISGSFHMNTKVWEAARAGVVPICSDYKPLFGLYGFEKGVTLEAYKDVDELLRILNGYKLDQSRYLSYRFKFLKHVAQHWTYEALYTQFFGWAQTLRVDDSITDWVEYLKSKIAIIFEDRCGGIYLDYTYKGRIVKQFPIMVEKSTILTPEMSKKNAQYRYAHVKILKGEITPSIFRFRLQRLLGWLYSRHLYWAIREHFLTFGLVKNMALKIVKAYRHPLMEKPPSI